MSRSILLLLVKYVDCQPEGFAFLSVFFSAESNVFLIPSSSIVYRIKNRFPSKFFSIRKLIQQRSIIAKTNKPNSN
jgi:hypothetical protein